MSTTKRADVGIGPYASFLSLLTSAPDMGIIKSYILSKRSNRMRHFLKKLIPTLLAIAILVSIGWYFMVYDTTLTRDLILQQAHRFEEEGNTSAAVWLYNIAYWQSGNDESVAIELSEQFKALGNYSKAESTLTKAIQDGGGVDVYIALCKTYLEQNKILDAVTMLDKVGNKEAKAQLDAMRPKAPVASVPSGSYTQYLQVEISAEGGKIYVNLNQDYPSLHTDAYTGPIQLSAGNTTIYAVNVGDNGLVSPLAVYGYIVGNVVEEVHLTDEHIDAALRALLQLGEKEAIYSNMLWGVEEFTIPQQATSCADLKWLPNLKKLTIAECAFTDFSPLSTLKYLHTLTVRETTIADSDLRFLANMKDLNDLTLSGCSISTIADMESMTSLQYLNLSNNTVRNISALAGMTELEELDLSYNALISLQDIQSLENLKILDVSYNSLASTAHVSTLVALTDLDVSSNNLMKLEGIDTLTQLQNFSAAYNNLTDVNILRSCTQLKTLDISHNTVLNILVLAELSLLEELDFSHNEVSRLPAFQSDCALRIIRGDNNLLTSLDNLSGLKNLTHVYMDYNEKLANINSLRHCAALQEVYVYGTRVSDISQLADAGILVNYTPKV